MKAWSSERRKSHFEAAAAKLQRSQAKHIVSGPQWCCNLCGSRDHWVDLAGDKHCQHCDEPVTPAMVQSWHPPLADSGDSPKDEIPPWEDFERPCDNSDSARLVELANVYRIRSAPQLAPPEEDTRPDRVERPPRTIGSALGDCRRCGKHKCWVVALNERDSDWVRLDCCRCGGVAGFVSEGKISIDRG